MIESDFEGELVWPEDEFYDSEGDLWRRNERGNYCRYEIGSPPDGVVFYRDGVWRALSTIFSEPLLVRGACTDAPEAAERLLGAEADGPTSDLWAPPNTTEWRPSKPTRDGRPGFWRKRSGTVLSVRQCKPDPRGRFLPSWTATIGSGVPVMSETGRPWHAGEEAAMQAADAEWERRSAAGEPMWAQDC
jgi:hypothetical protein